MATYRAVANGNWSSLATWEDNSGGSFAASSVLPGVGDNVYANGFVVQVDQTISVKSLKNTGYLINGVAITGINDKGRFEVSTNVNITTVDGIFGSWSAVVANHSVDNACLKISAICSPIITSHIFPGSTYCIGMSIAANATVSLVGNIRESWRANANGNSPGLFIPTICTLNMVGNVYAGYSTISYGIYTTLSAIMNITGNVYATNYPAIVASLGTVNVTGNIYAAGGSAISVSENNITHTIIGNVYATQVTAIYSTQVNTTINFEGNMYSESSAPIFAYKLKWNITPTTVYKVKDFGNNDKYLYGAGVNTGHPVEADVRKDTVYGPNDEFEGTLAVPPPATVNIGVPTDNTVGTYALSGDLITRLEKCSTVDITGQQIKSYEV